MSEENVELLHRALDAINRHDIDSILALSDPEIEFSTLLLQIEGGGPYRGHDGIRRWWNDLLAIFPDYRIEADEVRDLGDVTLARVRGRGHGIESEVLTEQAFWQVTEWRNNKGIWWHNFLTEAEALEAAGLRE